MAAEQAAPGAASPATLEELVVSASRREQNLQEVGTSIAVFSADELKTLAATDLTGIATRTPALQFNAFAPAVTVFNIRGVSQNDYGQHQEAPIAVYSDDSYLSAVGSVGVQMFDLAGIEVVRGPQGTLFGRNATGGLIHMITAKPTSTPEGYFSATVGSYDQLNTEGALSGPLSGTVRGRVSFATNYNEGYLTNRLGPDAGNSNNYALRLQLETDISADGKLLLSARGARNNAERYGNYTWRAAYPGTYGQGTLLPPNEDFWGTCAGCDALGYRNPSSDPYNQAYDTTPDYERTIYGAAATLTWNLPFATLVSVTDYSRLTQDYTEDTDASPNPVFIYNPTQTQYQYSQELRLTGTSGGLNWTTGLFYLNIDNDSDVFSHTPPLTAEALYDTSTRSWAVFGQVDYTFNPQWTVIAGLRYSSDRKEENYVLRFTGEPDIVFNTSTDPSAARRTFDGVSAKLELDYKPTDWLLTYVSYNRGIKGGGHLAPTYPPVDMSMFTFDTEVLTDYEAGFKLTGLDGRLTLNAGAFYYDYRDYQLFSYFNFAATITNHDAISKGGEIELVAMPVDGLTLRLGTSFLRTNVEDVVMPDSVTVRDTVMPQAPENSSTLLVRYEFPVAQGTMSLQTDWKHDSSQYFTAVNNPVEFQDSVTYGNVRVGYRFGEDRWEVGAFINNVSDERYSLFRSDFSGVGINEDVLARPRWYGVTVRYSL